MASLHFDFNGTAVLVTGGARGIGNEVASFFGRSGARVAVIDYDEEALHQAVERFPGELVAIKADVADPEAIADAVKEARHRLSGLAVLVNNAGLLRDGVSWKLSDDDWSRVLGVHLTGAFNLIRESIPSMRAAGWGRIVNVTSYSGLHGNFGQANYSAAKAGIIGLTKATAKELAPFGITVNAISPNARTAMVDTIPKDRLDELTKQIPAGRFASPSEMAAAIGFLASDEAAYITGVVLPVDGGLAM